MKIGILNLFFSKNNYGALLQAAALEQILKNNGHECEHINLVPALYLPSKTKRIVKLVMDLVTGKRKILSVLKGRGQTGNRQSKSIITGNDVSVFDEFRTKWITTSPRLFTSNEEMAAAKFAYEAYVVGSDQVWRAVYERQVKESYFLHFASDESLKIAYAASFGVGHWEAENDRSFTSRIKSLVQRFDAISVRESSGVEICRDIFDVKAEHVLDPTLVVGRDYFNSIIADGKNPLECGDIVYHIFSLNENFHNSMIHYAEENSLRLENIYFTKKEETETEIKGFYNKVPAWLKKIRDSNIVITDSYHCVCLSLIFEKQFVCLHHARRGKARLESLLGLLGLEDRFVAEEEGDEVLSSLLAREIDYSEVNERLQALKTTSLNFLFENINSDAV